MNQPTLFSAGAWRRLLGAVAGAALLLAGCGGGGDSVGTGGTGAPLSFSSGRISGFGSVIVNGVRFDDSAASVTDDDDGAHARGELKLGMTVDVRGGAVATDDATGAASATATSIQFHSEVKGPVQAVDAIAGTLTVLGQAITVNNATVFDGVTNALQGVKVGDLVEVFALSGTGGTGLTATRIEAKATLTDYRLRGTIANLDTAAKTFTIGGATVSYAGLAASDLPTLANGAPVRVTLQTTQQAGVWVAMRIRGGARAVPDAARSEVEGIVTDFSSLASFKVNGVPVDASAASVVFDNGTAATVANGRRLEVHGATSGGVLVATRVEFKLADGDDVEIELHGSIDTADAAAKTFTLRGQTVSYDDSTRIDDGSIALLVTGARVEVRGSLSSDGGHVVASRIRFEH